MDNNNHHHHHVDVDYHGHNNERQSRCVHRHRRHKRQDDIDGNENPSNASSSGSIGINFLYGGASQVTDMLIRWGNRVIARATNSDKVSELQTSECIETTFPSSREMKWGVESPSGTHKKEIVNSMIPLGTPPVRKVSKFICDEISMKDDDDNDDTRCNSLEDVPKEG